MISAGFHVYNGAINLNLVRSVRIKKEQLYFYFAPDDYYVNTYSSEEEAEDMLNEVISRWNNDD